MFQSIASYGFKLPLYERVRLQIQERLSKHVWDINQPIPSESELSEEYGVSVGTVRKAIERLVEDNLLVKIQGKGTFVKQPNFSASLMKFFRYRNTQGELIEPIGVLKKVEKISAIPAINGILKLAPTDSLIYLERVRLIDGAIMLSEKIWLPYDLFNSLLDISLQDFGNLLYPFYYDRCNQLIASANEKLTFVKGYRDMYLDNPADETLLKICRIANNLEHIPVEYRESFGCTTNFHYEVNIV
ncbi:GntR family transcriptional regulator [Entomomonas moraniae]|uniref:GntR family transcriptional regulator n=1 Tax=Entomomonas moraniae TaxID=2213226 RepID=A0A3Q9JJB3_9GAMM|nr:GntR family transcriptional regulator [Entomomonas moraniae]AZS50954.1 GntR family transcriptional regulator [Entomomonas moraniae]